MQGNKDTIGQGSKVGRGKPKRRLAAIMFTDMVGYTSLTQRNERLALKLLEEQRELLKPQIARHSGKLIKTIGDACLVEFASALEAAECAIAIQKDFHTRNASRAGDSPIVLRIGLHVGDVEPSGGDLYGDAVNIASRIEPRAEPGGICISDQAYDQIRNKVGLPIVRLGSPDLKNVQVPVEIYKVLLPWESSSPQGPLGVDRRRTAVLPLANISPDPKDEYFADGLTEELIAKLSGIPNLKVIARTSVMKYKGSNKGVGEIGQELRVGTMLEGSVRMAANRLRVTVQLIDANTEEHLWAQNYDRKMEDVFEIQSDIASRVAEALMVQFAEREKPETDRRATPSIEAYTLYLKGRHHWNRRSEEGVTLATRFFNQSIEKDPTFVLAYAGLSDCYNVMGHYGYRAPSSVYPKARELAEKALHLDENLAEAHASLAEALMNYYFDWDRTGAELKRAIELNPNYATAHLWNQTYHVIIGRGGDAMAEINRALDLDPLSLIMNTDKAKLLYFAHQYDRAEEQYRKTLEIDPDFAIAHKGLAEVYVQRGLFKEAIEEAQTGVSLSKGSIFIKDDLGYIYALAGREDDALKVMRELHEASTRQYVPPYGIAVIYLGLGKTDLALEWLERAYQERSFVIYLNVDPIFDSLRSNSRFASLTDKMRFGSPLDPNEVW